MKIYYCLQGLIINIILLLFIISPKPFIESLCSFLVFLLAFQSVLFYSIYRHALALTLQYLCSQFHSFHYSYFQPCCCCQSCSGLYCLMVTYCQLSFVNCYCWLHSMEYACYHTAGLVDCCSFSSCCSGSFLRFHHFIFCHFQLDCFSVYT